MDAAEAQALAQRIRDEVGKVVVGQGAVVDLLLIALLARGHVLMEGPPGVAKTLLARCFARAIGLDYGRIQFTPDLTPGDILGANLFNFQTSTFTLSKGPVFTELLLADEVNRSPPKTQAALLEAMQERTVTLDGAPHPLGDRFLVVATQNPIESQGVYPLPEAQLDRFLFKAVVGYPSLEEERAIVASQGARSGSPDPQALGVEAVCAGAELDAAAAAAAAVRLSPEIVDYVTTLVRATRESPEVVVGASPRGGAMLAAAARARALLDGRDYAVPDDVKALAPAALRHRLIMSAAAEMDGRRVEQVVDAVIARIEAPGDESRDATAEASVTRDGRSAYPTARAVALAGVGVAVAVLVGLIAPERWPLAFLCALAAALAALADFAVSASPSALRVEVAAPPRLAQGDEGEVAVRAWFDGVKTPLRLEGALDADGRIAAFPRVAPIVDGATRFRIRAVRRGRARLARLQVRWTGPLGLVHRQHDAPVDHDVVVTPDLAAARAASRSLGDSPTGGPKLDVRLGRGGEFRALRAYAPGDDRRMIDWKRSASRGALLVKEFQLEQNHPVVLALDTGRQMVEPIDGRPRLDRAISAGLALAYAGLAVGDRVRLCGFDAAVKADAPFVSGRGAFAALQESAAGLDGSTEATNYTLALHTVAGWLDRRALVVVFTEFTDTVGAELMLESVARLVRRHVVMFVVFRDAELEALVVGAPQTPEDVSRAVVAARLLRERELVLERLKRMGVRAVQTTPQAMGGAVVDAYLDIKRRDLA